MQDFGYSYDIFANLAARKDNLRNLEETFTYDHLNRLTDVWLNNVHTGHMAYDALGRMTDKRTDGQNVFSAAQHDYVGPDGQLRPHAISSATVEGNPFPTAQQSITYTMFDKVKTITQSDNWQQMSLSYAYGYDHQRTMMYETASSVTCLKHYVGNCEFVIRQGIQKKLTYLSGPMGVFAVVEKKNGEENMYYVLKDHLGSWTMITDDRGYVKREQSFDAWGIMRDPYTWTGNTVLLPMFDRGYTGHEHLNSFGLINMNGRMYDPIMSSFLSVDNYVQAPDFSQSFNRYAYCLNNPLKYIDPDGEWFWLIPNVGYSKDGGLSFGLTFAVGLPGLCSAQASLGYSVGSQSIYGSIGVSYAGFTGYVSAGYSFKNEQAFASIGITAGLSPYSGVPVSTNFLTVGASCDLTYSKAAGYDVSFTGNLSAWSYNTSAKAWNFNPSVSAMVYPEHTTNLVRGQGFRSNDAVLSRFVAANNHQGALDYFGFEGKYDPNCQDPGNTDRRSKTITYGDQAFANGYDYLYLTADHEQRHLANFKSGKYDSYEGPLDVFTHAEEEWSTYMYNYRRQGLYHKHGFDLKGRIGAEGIKAGIYGPSVLPNGQYSISTFSPKWWHFIYYIPRLY